MQIGPQPSDQGIHCGGGVWQGGRGTYRMARGAGREWSAQQPDGAPGASRPAGPAGRQL